MNRESGEGPLDALPPHLVMVPWRSVRFLRFASGSGLTAIGQLASFYCARCRHNGVMEDRKPKRRSMWLLIEFWFALLLTIGMMVYGVGSMIGALVDGS